MATTLLICSPALLPIALGGSAAGEVMGSTLPRHAALVAALLLVIVSASLLGMPGLFESISRS